MARTIGRRASRDDYEEPEEPRRRRGRDEEEETPRRRSRDTDEGPRRRTRDDDEDEAPRRRSESNHPAGRRRARDEDEEEAAPRRKNESLRGWATMQSVKQKSGNAFPESFTPSSEQTLILFVEDQPFASYREHWLDELEGRKSRTCLEDDCPLCEIGDNPRLRVCFNVIDWSNVDKPELKVWMVGVRLSEKLENFSKQAKTSPLNKEGLYWAVSKTGKGPKTDYNLEPVKERDLDEDWDRDPLDEADFDELTEKLFDETFIRFDSRKELSDIADDLS